MIKRYKSAIALFIILLVSPVLKSEPLVERISVGGYEFAPFVERLPDGSYDGVTFDLIDALNNIQDDYQFEFVTTLAKSRYKALEAKRFDLMFFEDTKWGWQDYDVVFSRVFLKGGESLISLKAKPNDEQYFSDFTGKTIIGIKGYHYAFADFTSNSEVLEEQYNLILADSSMNVIKLLKHGRGDIGLVPLSYILPYLKKDNDFASQVYISKKLDHQYEHRILVRNNFKITPNQLNIWIDQLEDKGILEDIWRKRGMAELPAWIEKSNY